MIFHVHTVETAPAGSKETLDAIKDRYGFIPNLAGVFAESPAAFKALLAALKAYDDEALTLTPIERQAVLLAVSVYNRCYYCTAAHSMLIHSLGVSKNDVEALQQDRPLSDARLEVLRRFTTVLVENRGLLDDAALDQFLAAGFTKAQVLEVILGISIKTLTNYANHVARPAVNQQFKAFLPQWTVAA